MAFLTGSHIYGTPTEHSDVDLVVLLNEWSEDDLRILQQATKDEDNEYGEHSSSLRFGKLNLIVCHSKKIYKAWKQGTSELIEKRPVTREQAMELLSKLRNEQ